MYFADPLLAIWKNAVWRHFPIGFHLDWKEKHRGQEMTVNVCSRLLQTFSSSVVVTSQPPRCTVLRSGVLVKFGIRGMDASRGHKPVRRARPLWWGQSCTGSSSLCCNLQCLRRSSVPTDCITTEKPAPVSLQPSTLLLPWPPAPNTCPSYTSYSLVFIECASLFIWSIHLCIYFSLFFFFKLLCCGNLNILFISPTYYIILSLFYSVFLSEDEFIFRSWDGSVFKASTKHNQTELLLKNTTFVSTSVVKIHLENGKKLQSLEIHYPNWMSKHLSRYWDDLGISKN